MFLCFLQVLDKYKYPYLSSLIGVLRKINVSEADGTLTKESERDRERKRDAEDTRILYPDKLDRGCGRAQN